MHVFSLDLGIKNTNQILDSSSKKCIRRPHKLVPNLEDVVHFICNHTHKPTILRDRDIPNPRKYFEVSKRS